MMKKYYCLFPIICLMCMQQLNAASFADGKTAYITQDYQTAFEILHPLAERGDPQAQVILGLMYDRGNGVKADPRKAITWYIKAAEQGIPMVQHDVGVKYFQGNGVKQDYQKAVYWWQKASDAGFADSEFNLGLLYYRGDGIGKDYQKALKLFTSAAEKDHPQAQYGLAVMHAFGQGVKKDYGEALDWFTKSAEQGVVQSQFNIGVFYENGYGIKQDLSAAKRWYERAAEYGFMPAKDKLVTLESGPSTVVAKDQLISPILSEQPPKTANNTVPQEPKIKEQKPAKLLPTTVAESVSSDGIKREDWLMQQNANNYTLQLVSVLDETDMLRFIRQYQLEAKIAYVNVIIKGQNRYNAVYGSFSSYEEAQQAVNTLPAEIRKNKPWARTFGALQKLIKQI